MVECPKKSKVNSLKYLNTTRGSFEPMNFQKKTFLKNFKKTLIKTYPKKTTFSHTNPKKKYIMNILYKFNKLTINL